VSDTTWKLHLRVSENKDGTGPDRFYSATETFPSFMKAKEIAKVYEEAKPPWLREIRIYREGDEN